MHSPVQHSVPGQFQGGVLAVSNNHQLVETLHLQGNDLQQIQREQFNIIYSVQFNMIYSVQFNIIYSVQFQKHHKHDIMIYTEHRRIDDPA